MLFATTSFGNGDYDLQRDSPCFPREPSCQIRSTCINAKDLSVTSCHHVMTYLHRHAKLPSGTRMATASKLIMDIMETEASVDHQMDASTMNLRLLVLLIRPRAQKSTDHVDHVSSGPAELRPRPRRPRPEQLHRAPTTSRAAPPSSDHADHDHVLSSSAELRPHRPPDHVAMMIAAKNGATTSATTVMATGRKARGPDNFIATNQMSIQDNFPQQRHPRQPSFSR